MFKCPSVAVTGAVFLWAHAGKILTGLKTCIGQKTGADPSLSVERGRSHRIYYALAAFDIAVVALGLMLAHHAIEALTRTVHANMEWTKIHSGLAKLRAVAGEANAPGNDIFESKDVAREMRWLDEASTKFEPTRKALHDAIAQKVPPAHGPELQALIDAAGNGMTKMVTTALILLEDYAVGDIEKASGLMAVMDRHYGDVIERVETASGLLRGIEMLTARQTLDRAQFYRSLELVGVAVIGVMVLLLSLYGVRVSKLVARQNDDLSKLSAELEQRVAERTAELTRSEAEAERISEELRRSNFNFDVAINNMNRGLCLFDREQRLVVTNKHFLGMYGLDPAIYKPGVTLREILDHRTAAGLLPTVSPEEFCTERLARAASGEPSIDIHDLRDGRVIELAQYPTADGGFVAIHDDITDRKRMEQQIVHLAHHDALTGLPNRRKLREELEVAIRRTERGDRVAVLCMDLDRFKLINDTLGHPVGDRLLQAVAERLRGVVRKSDIVCRLGGDEFAVVQLMTDQPTGAMLLASRIVEGLGRPYELDGHQLVIGVSIGIAMAPGDGQDADVLLKNADLALYRAKTDGKGGYRLFENAMDEQARLRRRLEMDLRNAVKCGELELFYQPLVDIGSGAITGFEALLRWRHVERGMVSPGEFIPLAEEMGLMGEIGAWVLETACREATRWPNGCRVAVNISPAQFRTREIDLDVTRALEKSGLAPDRLELEITESVLLDNTDSTMAVLHRLRKCGIRIAMDDFGTGYSSLSYLHSFPFDKIKIDRTFTQSAGTSSSAKAIVQAMLGLGRNLGMSTTAEGVETVEQLEHMRREGCAEVQGFLFSRPVPACEVGRLIERLAGEARGYDERDAA
jgi:diguanylate cyclase (GGDEF)-like protein